MPLTFTPLKASGKSRVPLDEIPEEVVSGIEEAIEYFTDDDNAGTRLSAHFDTQEAAETFLHLARSYAYWRKNLSGRVVISGNTTKKGEARFTIAAYVSKDTDEVEE